MKKSLVLFLVVVFILAAGLARGQGKFPRETDEWLKKSELGPYQARSYDEKQLYERAKAEKEVAVYSYSSRVHQFGKTFEERFAGLKVNGFDMDSTEIVTKVPGGAEGGKLRLRHHLPEGPRHRPP